MDVLEVVMLLRIYQVEYVIQKKKTEYVNLNVFKLVKGIKE